MNDVRSNILILDDDSLFRRLLQAILKEDFNVFSAEVPSKAFRILNTEKVDIMLCDFVLPEMDGLQVLAKVKDEHPGIEVIVMSASGDMDTVIRALQKGAADYIRKPFTAPEILLSLERVKNFHELRDHLNQVNRKNTLLNSEIKREMGTVIVGNSPAISNVKMQMQMVAKTPDTSVLIIGESGSGKELVARGIHEMSDRKCELFGAVNMSAVPESLFESEFFGHKKGSFTGAISDRSGWFETTDGGTLFLDEIGELPMGLQVKLLRVLDDRWYTKIGTQRQQKFDVRIVAATNKSLEDLTNGANFRLDLFHRIGTFIIHLPPLRDRREDIPDLSYYYLNHAAKKMGRKISSIHKTVFGLFDKYTFPGNIRELNNLIERAVIICQGDELLPEHFGSVGNMEPSSSLIQNQHVNTFDLKEIEKQTIIRALQKVNYNKAEAARLLNLDWNALYRRILKHQIELPSDNS